MNLIWIIAAIVTTLVGTLAALVTFTLLAASAANSTPAQATAVGWLMAIMFGVGLLGLVGAIVLLVLSRPGWAAACGGFPIAAAVGAIAYLSTVR